MFDYILLAAYIFSLSILLVYGCYGFLLIYYRKKYQRTITTYNELKNFEPVTIQLPVYNEYYVIERLINAVCEIEYPIEKLEIQVLDDSTDNTSELAAKLVTEKFAEGFNIKHITRIKRTGYKAGALREGLASASGKYIAVFDADFVPGKDFLIKTLPSFTSEEIGMVQTRWEHLNYNYSFLTRLQALALDAHFVMEQAIRSKAGFFINFNGTGGIWRRECIEQAGNWQDDTLTEDLDLSYRAQLLGWKFVFLRDTVSPAELPVEINSYKSQQYRWTKGAIETAKKLLPSILRSNIPARLKIHSIFHLSSNIVFPFILIVALLNPPLMFLKQTNEYNNIFNAMSIFVFGFIGSFLMYLYSQIDCRYDWKKRILYFPLFMAGSMGLSVNNARAVIEAALNIKTGFVRTRKFSIVNKSDSWRNNKYLTETRIDLFTLFEFLLGIYCLGGIAASVYFLEIAALPFQILFFIGYISVALLSVKHSAAGLKNN